MFSNHNKLEEKALVLAYPHSSSFWLNVYGHFSSPTTFKGNDLPLRYRFHDSRVTSSWPSISQHKEHHEVIAQPLPRQACWILSPICWQFDQDWLPLSPWLLCWYPGVLPPQALQLPTSLEWSDPNWQLVYILSSEIKNITNLLHSFPRKVLVVTT